MSRLRWVVGSMCGEVIRVMGFREGECWDELGWVGLGGFPFLPRREAPRF